MSNERKHILIVDDDVSLGEVLQQALAYSDHDVRLARNADEALAQVSRRHFDLLITDIKMEGFSGLQLLEALRQVAPNTQTIVMTAFGSTDIKDRAQMLGVYDYLTKPFTIHEFRNVITEALEAEAPSIPEKLPPSQLKSVNETLAELRANTGVHAAFFIEEETANVLGVASDAKDLDLTSLAKALMDITHRMTAEVAKVFGGGSGFRRSQYVGQAFNLSTYRLKGEGLLILVYGHSVKEGIISFYARQALEGLAQILRTEALLEPSTDTQPQGKAMLKAPTSPSRPAFSTPPPESDQEPVSEPLGLEEALAKGLLDEDFLQSLEKET